MLFYEALFSLLCHFYIVRVEEKSRVVFIEYIYATTSYMNVHV